MTKPSLSGVSQHIFPVHFPHGISSAFHIPIVSHPTHPTHPTTTMLVESALGAELYARLDTVIRNISLGTYPCLTEEDVEWGKQQLKLLCRPFDPADPAILCRVLSDGGLSQAEKACLWVCLAWGSRIQTMDEDTQRAMSRILKFAVGNLEAPSRWLQKHFPDQWPRLVALPCMIHLVTFHSTELLAKIARDADRDVAFRWWRDMTDQKLSFMTRARTLEAMKDHMPHAEVVKVYKELAKASVIPTPGTARDFAMLIRTLLGFASMEDGLESVGV